MLRLQTFVIPIFMLFLAFTLVISAPVVSDRDLSLLTKIRRDIGVNMEADDSLIPDNIIAMSNEKKRLFRHLTLRDQEQKRQRQCYWSVIACY